MNKTLKKLFVTGASLLMMASAGAGVGSMAHVRASHYRRVTLPRRYWGNWSGNQDNEGVPQYFSASLHGRTGYFRYSASEHHRTVFTRSDGYSNRPYLAWPYGIGNGMAQPFGLKGRTLSYTDEGMIFYLHRARRHVVRRRSRRVIRHRTRRIRRRGRRIHRIVHRRRARAKKVYHIIFQGHNMGSTTSYRSYKANMNALNHALQVHNANVAAEQRQAKAQAQQEAQSERAQQVEQEAKDKRQEQAAQQSLENQMLEQRIAEIEQNAKATASQKAANNPNATSNYITGVKQAPSSNSDQSNNPYAASNYIIGDTQN